MRTVDFDTPNLHRSNHHAPINLYSTCSPNKALQVTIFPLLRNGKTAAELCVELRESKRRRPNKPLKRKGRISRPSA